MAVKFTSPLNSIKVASPCSADWDAMVGNNRQRFCGQCKMNVYNLSGMTQWEAESLLMNAEGRLCARFFQRSDGTIITKDCPVGWQAIKQRMSKVWTAVASILITAVSGIGITTFMSQNNDSVTMGEIAIETPHNNQPEMGKIAIQPNNQPELVMGDIAMPQDAENQAIMGKVKISTN